MSRLIATGLFCLGLVVTRLLGVHLHVCAGLEHVAEAHEQPHYADAGLLFGESHDSDHADDREVELAAAVASVHLDFDAVVLPGPDRLTLSAVTGWLSSIVPQGPPAAEPSRPLYFTPPLRGPPSIFLT